MRQNFGAGYCCPCEQGFPGECDANYITLHWRRAWRRSIGHSKAVEVKGEIEFMKSVEEGEFNKLPNPADEASKRLWATNICKELAIPENDQVLKVLVWALNTWVNGRAGLEMTMSPTWTLDIHMDGDNKAWATLHENGKMDTTVEILKSQLPWFNALRHLLRGT